MKLTMLLDKWNTLLADTANWKPNNGFDWNSEWYDLETETSYKIGTAIIRWTHPQAPFFIDYSEVFAVNETTGEVTPETAETGMFQFFDADGNEIELSVEDADGNEIDIERSLEAAGFNNFDYSLFQKEFEAAN